MVYAVTCCLVDYGCALCLLGLLLAILLVLVGVGLIGSFDLTWLLHDFALFGAFGLGYYLMRRGVLVVWLALVLYGWCGMCSGVLLCCLICWYSGLLFAFGGL